MNRQLIVSIGREYGSAGREIAEKLAGKLNIELYDRNLLDEVADTKNVNTNDLEKYDEVPKKRFFSRTVRGYNNSPEANIAELQFALLKSKAADDDSFVVVGRCADDLFRGMRGFVSIFIYSDTKSKVERIMRLKNLDEKQALHKIERHDRKRAAYHNYFSKGGKWGERSNYDLCVNSGVLGIEGTVDFLYDYIQRRVAD